MPKRPDNWAQLTHDQKREWRLAQYMDSYKSIKFVSQEAELKYKNALKRLADVYRVQEPDRVPVAIHAGMVPLYSHGLDYYTAIYEPEKAVKAIDEFCAEGAIGADSLGFSAVIPAPVYDILDYRLYAYPGHGLSKSGVGFQFIEGEYMRADEYDALLKDPSAFWMRTFLPRVFGILQPLTQLKPLTVGEVMASIDILDNADVQALLSKLLEAGQEFTRLRKISRNYLSQAQAHGYPGSYAGSVFASAPFDTLGDALRGTSGIMMDMYRQPDNLLKALDIIADIKIESVLNSPRAASTLMVSFFLHKGADGWMSSKQFDTFYWPSLQKVINAFINEGMIANLFLEGSYNTRLDSVNVFPKGTVHWRLDQTDMAKAKQVLGGNFSIEGSVSSSLLCTGSPEEVKEYCRNLLEICAPGGGYVLSQGGPYEFPKMENLKAMVAAAHEYGVYRT